MLIEQKQMTKASVALLIFLGGALILGGCGAKEKVIKKRQGDQEIVTVKKGKEIVYKIVYTYQNGKKVLGEHWVPVEKKDETKKEAKKTDQKADKKKGNILSNSAIAKKYESLLARKKFRIRFDPELGKVEAGFRLNFAQKVMYYPQNGKPAAVFSRGYTDIPILGRFQIKTNTLYKYDAKGKLTKVLEKNMNVDTLLLKQGIANVTSIAYDQHGRPTLVTKAVGSIPPTVETTRYYYRGKESPYLLKTVYDKVGLNGLSVQKTETITFFYDKKIPWYGFKKYDFQKSFAGLLIYDHVKKKNKLDGSNFGKMNYIQKGLFLKSIYDLVQMEMQGPTWRMGTLPDTPHPFANGHEDKRFGDYAWFN